MAVTAVLSVDESSISSRQKAQFVLILTNGGGADETVTSCSISAEPNQSASLTVPVFYPPTATVIPASGGTLVTTCGAVFFANVVVDGDPQTQSAFEVTANVALASGASVTSNTVTVQVTPIYEPTIPMPTEGQLRFDSNNNSDLLAVIS